ncbi:DUF2974 domain-containing protein [Candidatus Saccharibacteria bacterium]|nr:DUF2974 domain-containing protein [Candidatus Saccharibacteria bacterium]
MSNIIDYVKVYGGHKIDRAVPFCELDAMVLSRFSYLPFHKIELNEIETVASIAKKMRKLKEKDFAWPEDAEYIKTMGFSERFSALEVTDYRSISSKKITEQFMAITIHISPAKLFISYNGTDNSLHGWREDLNLALLDEIPAQLSGAKYFKDVADKYPLKKVYLGGHSKGGNIAMYSAIISPDPYQNRIIMVYSQDAPGMSKKVIEKDTGASVLPRIIHFIPQDSVVGRLLNHSEKFEVIKSSAKNFWQHNVYSWEVDLSTRTLVRSKSTKKSNFVDKTLDRWLQDATEEQKKEFADLLFKVLENSKVGTPVDIGIAGIHAIPPLLKSYRSLPREERTVIAEFIKKLLVSAYEVSRKK